MLASDASSSSELAQMITKNSKSFYSTGASWDGYVIASIDIGVVFAALIA